MLPRERLIDTGQLDRSLLCYRPVVGFLPRGRYELARALLPAERAERALEIGYGSGIFMSELAQHARQIFGIDMHSEQPAVRDALAQERITAHLESGNGAHLPFPDSYFDVAVSTNGLASVSDVGASCFEIDRVLKEDGRVIVVIPAFAWFAEAASQGVFGKNVRQHSPNSRQLLMPMLRRHFEVETSLSFPKWLSNALPLYRALRLRKLGSSTAPDLWHEDPLRTSA